MNKKGLLAVVLLFSAHIVLGMKKAKHINKDTKIILVFKDINVPITQKGLFLSSKFKEIESIFGDTTRYEYFNKDNNEFTIYLDSFMQGSWAKDIELKDIENYAKLSDDKTALKSLSFERLIRLAQLAYFFGATRTEYEEPTKTKSIKKVVVFFPLRDLLREVLECIVTSKITEEDYLNFLKDEGKLCEFVNKIPDDVLNNVACEIFFGNKPIDTIELKHGRWLISSLLSSGNRFALWEKQGVINIWKKNEEGKYKAIQKLNHGSRVNSISSLTDDIFASGGEYGNIKIWKKNKKGKYEQIQELKHGSSVVYLLPLSGNRFASWGKQGVIKIFEKNEKGKYEQIQELKHGSSVIYLLPLSGNRLASLGKDKNFNIWNYKSYYASFDQAVLINALRLKHAEEKGILNKRNISIIKKNILDELSDAARKIFEKIPSRKISQMRRFGWIKISDEDFKWIENKQRSEKEERNFLGKIKKLQKEIAQVPAKSKDGVIKLYKKMVALKSKMRTQEGKEKVTQIINDVRKERMDVFAEYLFRKFIKKIENGKGSQDDLLSAENLLKAIIKLKKDDKKMAQKIEMLQKRYNEAEKKIIKQEELEGVE